MHVSVKSRKSLLKQSLAIALSGNKLPVKYAPHFILFLSGPCSPTKNVGPFKPVLASANTHFLGPIKLAIGTDLKESIKAV